MIQVEIDSVASFVQTSRRAFQGFGKSVIWFRGQGSAKWGLVPSVHRNYDQSGEHSLAARFRLSAPTRHLRTPELTDLAAWMSLMQHFGLPTRLLDWSASPLVAMYFAICSEPQVGDAAVWGILPSRLNLSSKYGLEEILVLSGPEARPMLVAGLDRGAPVDDVLAVMSQDVDLRMTVQQGAFTVHGTDAPLDGRAGADGYLAKFVIPASARQRLLEELWFLGVRRASLFPDLANLALDLASDHRMIPRKQSE